MRYFAYYLLLANGLSFLLFGIDKKRAIDKQWRIPEKTLLLSAALGGAAGAFLGMKLFRHKTHHLKFSVGVPLLFVLEIILSVLLYFYVF